MDDANDYLIKFVPAFLAVLISFFLYEILRCVGCGNVRSAVLTIIFIANFEFVGESFFLYAENLLILYLLGGFFLLSRHLSGGDRDDVLFVLGLAMLAGAAWTKNEGLMIFCVTVIAFILSAGFKRVIHRENSAAFLAVFICLVLPWIVFRSIFDIAVRDFNFEKYGISDWEEIFSAASRVLGHLFSVLFITPRYSGIWILFFTVVLLSIRDAVESRPARFFLISIAGIMCAYPILFVFSARNFNWHLLSFGRILLSPALLSILFIAHVGVSMERKLRRRFAAIAAKP
jgi:hypothetical protein